MQQTAVNSGARLPARPLDPPVKNLGILNFSRPPTSVVDAHVSCATCWQMRIRVG